MVGHQYIRMNEASSFSAIFLQPFQIKQIIVLRIEAGLPVVASLNNVGGNPRCDDSWSIPYYFTIISFLYYPEIWILILKI